MDTERYKALMDAVKILSKARTAVYSGEEQSPAWSFVVHAQVYLEKQAFEAFRVEEVSA